MAKSAYFSLLAFIFVLLIWSVFLPVSAQTPTLLPTSTPTPYPQRDIEIEVYSNENSTGLFEIGEIFTFRDREGFSIWTYQANFWQPGDELNAGSLAISIIFDDEIVVEPFVFWANGSIQEVTNEKGKKIGSYLWSPMTINISTRRLDLGEHSMTVQVEHPGGKVFEETWEFVIRERENPRQPAPPDLVPTLEYLYENPASTPSFFTGSRDIEAYTVAHILDRFSPIGRTEGICFGLDDAPFIDPNATPNPFRKPAWEDRSNLRLLVNNMPLTDDLYGMGGTEYPGGEFICLSTDHLASGTHLATIIVTVDGIEYSYTWAFVIE